MKKWQLQEAKNRFSELVEEAVSNGPQWVTKHGEDAVVVVSIRDYSKLAKRGQDLASFFRESPLFDSGISLERAKDFGRKHSFS